MDVLDCQKLGVWGVVGRGEWREPPEALRRDHAILHRAKMLISNFCILDIIGSFCPIDLWAADPFLHAWVVHGPMNRYYGLTFHVPCCFQSPVHNGTWAAGTGFLLHSVIPARFGRARCFSFGLCQTTTVRRISDHTLLSLPTIHRPNCILVPEKLSDCTGITVPSLDTIAIPNSQKQDPAVRMPTCVPSSTLTSVQHRSFSCSHCPAISAGMESSCGPVWYSTSLFSTSLAPHFGSWTARRRVSWSGERSEVQAELSTFLSPRTP
jgi:hypothetical protein